MTDQARAAAMAQLDLLGFRAKDKITGFIGVVTSVSFDLYGCVQVVLSPPLDKDGKKAESFWFDATRLEILEPERVMDPPARWSIASDPKGPAEKPAFD